MKKIFLAMSLFSFVVYGCDSTTQESSEVMQEDVVVAQYACPMECEGDKTYEEAGKCPTCKMDLVAVQSDIESHDEHEGHDH